LTRKATDPGLSMIVKSATMSSARIADGRTTQAEPVRARKSRRVSPSASPGAAPSPEACRIAFRLSLGIRSVMLSPHLMVRYLLRRDRSALFPTPAKPEPRKERFRTNLPASRHQHGGVLSFSVRPPVSCLRQDGALHRFGDSGLDWLVGFLALAPLSTLKSNQV